MTEFGFLVAACLRGHEHLISLCENLQSIQKFHPEAATVVIFDHTSDKSLTWQAAIYFPNVLFETDTPEVPADMLMLSYLKEKRYFKKAVTLQDSMRLTSRIEWSGLSGLQYLWHFTNHRVHWHTIEEPQNEFNVANRIKTHDDLVEYCLQNLIQKPDFQKYALDIYRQKERWSGCFGCLCFIDLDTLDILEDKTGILGTMKEMKDNRMRRAIESIFSLACQYALNKEIHDSLDGLYYDGVSYHNNFQGKSVAKKSYNRQ